MKPTSCPFEQSITHSFCEYLKEFMVIVAKCQYKRKSADYMTQCGPVIMYTLATRT